MRTVQYSLKQLIEVWHVRWAEAASLAAAEKCVYALAVRRRDEPAPRRVTRTSKVTSVKDRSQTGGVIHPC